MLPSLTDLLQIRILRLRFGLSLAQAKAMAAIVFGEGGDE